MRLFLPSAAGILTVHCFDRLGWCCASIGRGFTCSGMRLQPRSDGPRGCFFGRASKTSAAFIRFRAARSSVLTEVAHSDTVSDSLPCGHACSPGFPRLVAGLLYVPPQIIVFPTRVGMIRQGARLVGGASKNTFNRAATSRPAGDPMSLDSCRLNANRSAVAPVRRTCRRSAASPAAWACTFLEDTCSRDAAPAGIPCRWERRRSDGRWGRSVRLC